MIVVKGQTALRFERRWSDYLQVLERGTPASVGVNEPPLLDLREAVSDAFERDPTRCLPADAVLDQAWTADARSWPRRLSKFLTPLSQRAQRGFADLVKAGCQPDMLAFQFSEAAKARDYENDRERLLADLDALDRLAAQAVSVLEALANRRYQFDDYLLTRGLRAIEGDPGDAELKILLIDLKDIVARHHDDNQYVRRKLDRRRESLLGHAEVRLSRRVHEVTGAYHDRIVEEVLDEVRAVLGEPPRGPGALKERRKRWRRMLGSPPTKN